MGGVVPWAVGKAVAPPPGFAAPISPLPDRRLPFVLRVAYLAGVEQGKDRGTQKAEFAGPPATRAKSSPPPGSGF